MNLTTSPKTFWSILKNVLDDKKISCITPLFHDNKFMTNFKEKIGALQLFFILLMINYLILNSVVVNSLFR